MWRNFRFLCKEDVLKSEISPYVKNFQNFFTRPMWKISYFSTSVMCVMWKMSLNMYNLCCFVVKLVLLRFTHSRREICFVAIYALLCGEKLSNKLPLFRKKWQISGMGRGAQSIPESYNELGLIMEETREWTSQGGREAQSIPQLVIESAEHKSQSGNTTHCSIFQELARRHGEKEKNPF